MQIGHMVITEQGHYGVTMQRLDGIKSRIGRIARRFDVTYAPAA
jgi:hypothetical protein